MAMKWGEQYAHKADAFASTPRWWREARRVAVYSGFKDRVLDVGCNTGRLGLALKDRGVRYFGMDPNQSALRIARKRMPECTFSSTLGVFTSDSFDTVYVLHTVNQMENRDEDFVQIWNLLKAGGVVVVTTHNPLYYVSRIQNMWNGYKSDPTMVWEPKLGQLKQFLWDHGFVTEVVEYFGSSHWSHLPFLRERLLVVARKPYA